MVTPKITYARYVEANDAMEGWCTACRAWTREMTEPDAEAYDCPACEQNTVMGAEQAMMLGVIVVKDVAKPKNVFSALQGVKGA